MKQVAEESAIKKTMPMAKCEIDESSINPIDQYFWTKTESAACLLINDETAQSSSSEASKDNGADSADLSITNSEAKKEGADSDTEMIDLTKTMSTTSPRKSLDELLRLHNKRLNTRESEREKSISPDENLNIQNFAQRMFENSLGTTTTTNFLLNELGLNNNNNNNCTSMPFLTSQTSDFGNNSNLLNFHALANRLKGSELLKALSKPTKNNNSQQQNFNNAAIQFSNQFLLNNSITATFNAPESTHMNEILNKYIWNSWDLPENGLKL